MNEHKWNSGTVPPEVYRALRDFIDEQDMECADNFRFSPEDDGHGLNEYEDIRDSGCCGYFDRVVEDNTGRKWKVGCNYGH